MKVLIAGDFCPQARGQEIIKLNDFSNNFNGIKELTESADFSIVNFETNIPTHNSKPIEKFGPCLSTTPDALKLVKYWGFNVVTLANNHFFDYGQDAVINTLKYLDNFGIEHVGGGRDIKEAKKTLFLNKGDETIAIINACEHEFSIASKDHGGCYGIDPIQIYYDIRKAKDKASYVLVITHGGHECHQLPSIRMQEWYRFFIDAGADAVINHHQHCYSGREIYKNKPIYYGLGNFFFDKENQKEMTTWNKGILVELNFSRTSIEHKAIPFIQCFDTPSIILTPENTEFIEKFNELNEIINDENTLVKKNQEFYNKCKLGVLGNFQPYGNRILRYAYLHNLIPSYLSKKQLRSILNMIECEAHHDRLRNILHETLYL